jgi:hypothetical protein
MKFFLFCAIQEVNQNKSVSTCASFSVESPICAAYSAAPDAYIATNIQHSGKHMKNMSITNKMNNNISKKKLNIKIFLPKV